MYVGDLNLDVAGSGFSRCEYGKPVVKKKHIIKNQVHTQNQNLL